MEAHDACANQPHREMIEPVTPPDPARADERRLDGGGLRVTLSTPTPTTLVAEVAGELDLATAPHLEAQLTGALLPDRHTLVVVDLTGLRFLGVAGVTVLLGQRGRAEREFIGFRLVATSRPVLRPLTLLELADSFDIHPTIAEALRPLG